MDLDNIKLKEIQDAVKPFNMACGLEIKDSFRKKDEIVDEFIKMMETRLDEAPQVSIDLYNKLKGNGAAPEGSSEAIDPVVVEVEEAFNVVLGHAKAVGIEEIPEGISLDDLETLIYDTTGNMSAGEWDDLPTETQGYDNDLVNRRKAAKAAESDEHVEDEASESTPDEEPKQEASDGEGTEEEKAASTDEQEASKPVESKPKTDPKAPRPGFRYSPNTSAGMIMAELVSLAAKCDNKGVKEADILAASKEKGIASVNLKGRVSTVLRYASTPPGGSQCSKEGGLWISNIE